MATTATELGNLVAALTDPERTSLLVRVVLQGELQIEVDGPDLQRLRLFLESGVVTDLYRLIIEKDGHPSWLKNSNDLINAFQNGWLVLDQSPAVAVSPVIVPAQPTSYIPSPLDPRVGDLLVFNGTEWVGLPSGPSSYVLTSNGAGFVPSYQPTESTNTGSSISGQNTSGLTTGDVCYLYSANTWKKASSDQGLNPSMSLGLFGGTTGKILLIGSVVMVKCTTDGGTPPVNSMLFLAKSTDDSGTASGKVTSVPPVPPIGGTLNLQTIGVCVDNTSYATSKVVKAIFQPSYPIKLIG